jgi:hypothetical protein
MNITSEDGNWKLEIGFIINQITGEKRRLQNTPSANAVAYMDYDKFLCKCQIAFDMGTWPMTHWKSGRITY